MTYKFSLKKFFHLRIFGDSKSLFFPLLCSEGRRKTDLKYAFRIVMGHVFFSFLIGDAMECHLFG